MAARSGGRPSGLSAVLQRRSLRTGAAFAADLLALVREQLGMEIGFISEFRDGDRVFLFVDSELSSSPIKVGDSDPLADTYCGLVADGTLPSVITDAGSHPLTSGLPVTRELEIGGHVSVPIRRASGEVFGTLCCFSSRPEPSLGDLDLAMVDLVAKMLGSALESDLTYYEWRGRVEEDLRGYCSGGLRIVVQPIINLDTGAVAGFEALTRFPGSEMPPDSWFAAARALGWGPRLETAAAQQALACLTDLPLDGYLSLNASPEALTSAELGTVLDSAPGQRVVIEVTEHTSIGGEPALLDSLGRLRAAGFRVAVDDAGSGYAGLRQILSLRPDLLKLDRDLTRGIEGDEARQALAMALSLFARRIGAEVVAEGIETGQQRDMIQSLGVGYGQGYFFGRPRPATHLSTAADH